METSPSKDHHRQDFVRGGQQETRRSEVEPRPSVKEPTEVNDDGQVLKKFFVILLRKTHHIRTQM